jgi:hypothetical protein
MAKDEEGEEPEAKQKDPSTLFQLPVASAPSTLFQLVVSEVEEEDWILIHSIEEEEGDLIDS